MSSYIVEHKTINRILSSMTDDFIDTFFKGKSRTEIGKKLLWMNIQAVNYKYAEGTKKESIYQNYSFERVKVFLPQAIMSTRCLLYQCIEGNIDKTKLFKIMDDFSDILAHSLAREIAEEKKCEWA